MVKGSIRALLVTILAVPLVLPFSIYSFADPYLGTEFVVNSDGTVTLKNNNPSGQTFSSGSNIQYNVWNNNPVIDDNTFNGSTSITNTFNQLTSADNNFTGHTNLQVVEGGGNIESNLDTFNSMTVAAAGTNLNFNDSTFQGAVNINDAGVVQIGSTTESAQIVTNTSNTVTAINNLRTDFNNKINSLSNLIFVFEQEVAKIHTSSTSTVTIQNPYNSQNVTLQLNSLWLPTVSYNSSTKQFSFGEVQNAQWLYVNMGGRIFLSLRQLNGNLAVIMNGLSDIAYSIFNTWWAAYLPNKNLAQAQYWIAYNTDTDSYDSVNLATVFGYMTWYLGQMYIQGNEAAADISNSVSDMATAFTDLETKENQINSSIKNSLNSVDSFFNLPAIASGSVVIGWLQYMWVSLGMFQGVTIIAWALIILTIVTGFYKVKRITV